jgi:hypothetical protein
MMFNVTKIAFVAALGLFIFLIAMQAVASDRSVRCGTYLIYAGGGKDSASMYEVLKKCGEPEAKTGNNWIYIQGSMLRILTFNYEGRLQTIESERK